MATWIHNEILGNTFSDHRLDQRFEHTMDQLSDHIGESIPSACQEWAQTKAAYRFLSNDKVSEDRILAGHFEATKARFAENGDGVTLVLHDTT